MAIKSNSKAAVSADDELKELCAFAAPPPHHCIVRFIGILPCTDRLDYVMELAAGGSLEELLRDPERANALRSIPKWVGRLLRCVLSALDHIHAAGFVHRDLAARNILLDAADADTQIAKLADWGACSVVGS